MALNIRLGRVCETIPPKASVEALLGFYQKVVDGKHDANRFILHKELIARGEKLMSQAKAIESRVEPTPASLLREVTDSVRETAVQVTQLADGLQSPFMLFVIGMGKFGKSTLINALVGSRVADMDVLPKTWKIDIFSASQKDQRVVIKTRDGQRLLRSVSEAKAFLAEEEKRRLASEDEIYAQFSRRSKSLKTIEEKEDLLKALRKELLYESIVSEVHWPCRRSELMRRFDIIDTPGLIQELAGEIQEDLRTYYHKADGVLWMLDATKVASEKPRALLDELEQALSQVGGRSNNIIGVLNRIDLIDPADRLSLLKEAMRIYEGQFISLIPFSAKWALEAAENNDDRAMRGSGLPDLKREIDRRFLSRAIQLQLDSKTRGLKGYVQDLAADVNGYLNRLSEDEARRKALEDELKKSLDEGRKHLDKTFTKALDAYAKEVRLNISRHTETLFELDSEEKRSVFLAEKVFEEETLEATIQEGSESLHEYSVGMLEYMRRKSVFHEFKHLGEAVFSNAALKRMESKDETIVQQFAMGGTQLFAGVAAGGLAVMLLGPIGIALGALAFTGIGRWALIQLRLPGTERKLRLHLNKMMDQISGEHEKKVEAALEQVSSLVTEVREESFAALHGPSSQLDRVAGALKKLDAIGNAPLEQPELGKIILGRYA